MPVNCNLRNIIQTDKIKLRKPENINIYWVIDQESNLLESVSNFKWLRGKPYVWVACEYSKMKSLRNSFPNKKKKNWKNKHVYLELLEI